MKQAIIIDMMPIGSLQVFALLTEIEYACKASYDNKIYWTDNKATTPQGPYPTVWNALENYKAIVIARRTLHDSEVYIPMNKLPQTPVLMPDIKPVKSNILDLDAFRASKPKKHW